MADVTKTIKLQEFAIPVPDALHSFDAVAFSSTIIDLSWLDPGYSAVDYEIQYGTDPTFAVHTQIILGASGGTGGIHSVTGLITATTYYFRMRALNDGGASPWSTDTETTP